MQLQKTLVAGTYPVQRLDLPKPCGFTDADDVVEAILRQLEEHPNARLIAVFDLLEHSWDCGADIPPDLLAVKQVIFCFGTHLPNPDEAALRPCSISVTESVDRFVVSYMETPVAEFNVTMGRWVGAMTEANP